MTPAAHPEEEQTALTLARRIRDGDRAAEQALVERYSRGLRLMLRHVASDPQLAEDVHQEAFAVLITRLREDSLDDPGRLGAFLQATARLLVLNHKRRGARRATVANTELIERTAGSRTDPAGAMLRAQARELVRDAIAGLVPRDRDVLVRFYLRDQPREVICAEHGMTDEHFYRVLCRARQRLRRLIEERADRAVGDGRTWYEPED